MKRLSIAPLALACLAGTVACSAPDRVVIEIVAEDFDPADELSTIEITIAASRSAAGDQVCEPYTQSFSLVPGSPLAVQLPFVAKVEAGSEYDRVLFIRVIGRQLGTIRIKTERMASLRGGDVRQLVSLTSSCLGIGTGRGLHCQGGFALPSPFAAIFDDGVGVEPGEACLAP